MGENRSFLFFSVTSRVEKSCGGLEPPKISAFCRSFCRSKRWTCWMSSPIPRQEGLVSGAPKSLEAKWTFNFLLKEARCQLYPWGLYIWITLFLGIPGSYSSVSAVKSTTESIYFVSHLPDKRSSPTPSNTIQHHPTPSNTIQHFQWVFFCVPKLHIQ